MDGMDLNLNLNGNGKNSSPGGGGRGSSGIKPGKEGMKEQEKPSKIPICAPDCPGKADLGFVPRKSQQTLGCQRRELFFPPKLIQNLLPGPAALD